MSGTLGAAMRAPGQLAVAALLTALGCTVPPAQLVVVVDTDMTGAELDGFATRVLDGGGQLVDERTFARGATPPAVRLPASFGVAPEGGDTDRRVTVEVIALRGGAELFRTRARTGFVAEQALTLDMFLARRCVAEAATCGPGRTCRRDGCEDEWIAPGTLRPFRGIEDDGLDAGGDASSDASPDAAADASRDAEPDADADAGTLVPVPWSILVEGTRLLTLVDGAVAADGTFTLAGDFRESLTVDGQQLAAIGDRDAFVTSIAPDGIVRWVQSVGGTGAAVSMTSVVAAPGGELWLAGVFLDALAAPWSLDSGGAQASFLGRFAADGGLVEAFAFTSTELADLESIALGADGRLALGGVLTADLDGPAGSLVVDGDAAFVGVLDAADGAACLLPVTGTLGPTITSVTWSAGNVVAAGTFAGDLSADTEAATAAGTRDAYVVVLDPDCGVLDLRTVGGELSWARVGDAGTAVQLFARAIGPLADDGAPLPLGGMDVLGARIVQAIPGVQLGLSGGTDRDAFFDLYALGGSVWAAGSFEGSAGFGDAIWTSAGSTDAFVFRVDENGDAQPVLQLGGAARESIEVVAADPSGALFVAGTFDGASVDLGEAGTVEGGVGTSAFVARLAGGE